ncbi:hypothetical protein J6W32_04870 [bacterium]|nr:hypothetical protein [bacterium]MBP5783891.1 hypothetical protein [bacterium]
MTLDQYLKISPIKLASYFVNKYNGQFFLSSDHFTDEAKKKLMQINEANEPKIASAINEAIMKKLAINSKQKILLSQIYHHQTKDYCQYFVKVRVYENKHHADFLVSEGTYTCFIF